MNIKVTAIIPLAILLFVFDVYCAPSKDETYYKSGSSVDASDDAPIVDKFNIYVNCTGKHATIVVRDDDDEFVFKFSVSKITQLKKSGKTGVHVRIITDSGGPWLYKFNFERSEDAGAVNSLLTKLKDHTGTPKEAFDIVCSA